MRTSNGDLGKAPRIIIEKPAHAQAHFDYTLEQYARDIEAAAKPSLDKLRKEQEGNDHE